MFKIKLVLCIFAILASSLALAGTEVNNGGAGEIEFKSIRLEIATWMKKLLDDGSLDKKLDLAHAGVMVAGHPITGAELYNKYIQTMETGISFQTDPIGLIGYSTVSGSKICGNDPSPARIVCNSAEWKNHSTQVQYGIVLHEILGVAGLETNQAEYSQYPISARILPFVKRTVHYELGEEAIVPTIALGQTVRFYAENIKSNYVGTLIQISADGNKGTIHYTIPDAWQGHDGIIGGVYNVEVPIADITPTEQCYQTSDTTQICVGEKVAYNRPTHAFTIVDGKRQELGEFGPEVGIVKAIFPNGPKEQQVSIGDEWTSFASAADIGVSVPSISVMGIDIIPDINKIKFLEKFTQGGSHEYEATVKTIYSNGVLEVNVVGYIQETTISTGQITSVESIALIDGRIGGNSEYTEYTCNVELYSVPSDGSKPLLLGKMKPLSIPYADGGGWELRDLYVEDDHHVIAVSPEIWNVGTETANLNIVRRNEPDDFQWQHLTTLYLNGTDGKTAQFENYSVVATCEVTFDVPNFSPVASAPQK